MADYIRPTPRNPILGLLADALTGGVDWMRDRRQTQQMQGLGGLLAETGIPATVERLSYGEPLTTGRGMTTRLRPEAEAALMTLGPEAVPIGRGAMAAARAAERGVMAAGRAGEKIAERVVPQVMERGGLPAQVLEGMASQTVSPLTVYHGSPYRFQRFDPTKIGSGEGAQAYGYGHYVAESPDVAKGYQKATSKDKFISGQGFFDPSQLEHLNVKAVTRRGDLDQAIAEARKYAAPDSDYPETAAKAARDLSKLEALKSSGGMRINEGSLYTIDLPDPAIARMLDWDKKFSEQPENVQRGIIKYWSDNPGLKYYGRPEQMTGEGIYGSVKAASLGPEGGARINLNPANQAAAMDLRYQGIPGIRYLDQGSRGAGQGTSNFVVFPGEEDLLRILSVDGGLLGR